SRIPRQRRVWPRFDHGTSADVFTGWNVYDRTPLVGGDGREIHDLAVEGDHRLILCAGWPSFVGSSAQLLLRRVSPSARKTPLSPRPLLVPAGRRAYEHSYSVGVKESAVRHPPPDLFDKKIGQR